VRWDTKSCLGSQSQDQDWHPRVQSERDLKSARRDDEETQELVEEKTAGGKPLERSVAEASEELSLRRRKASARAKAAYIAAPIPRALAQAEWHRRSCSGPRGPRNLDGRIQSTDRRG